MTDLSHHTANDTLLDSIRSLNRENGMIAPGGLVVAAVSGGPDSSAMLHALAALRAEYRMTLVAAHLHHGLRGKDADCDAVAAQGLSTQLEVPFVVECSDVRALSKRLHLGLQEAARTARMAFLDRVAYDFDASRVALGHTNDDHIETLLLNIIRGTGMDGLRGLSPMQEMRIRPLLNVSHADTVDYCMRHGIQFREDASNSSLKYKRNRVRYELLPLLALHYNSAIREALARLSNIASAECDYMEFQARRALRESVEESRTDRIVWCTSALRDLHPAVMRRVLRQAVEGIRGSLQDVDLAAIQRLVDAVQHSGTGDSGITFPDGAVAAHVTSERVTIRKIQPPVGYRTIIRDLALPGVTPVPELGITVSIERVTGYDMRGPRNPQAGILVRESAITPPLVVRNRRAGDRIRPMGLCGSKKLQDLFVDRKVNVNLRALIPLICDAAGILWVAGHALDERAEPPDATESALLIRIDDASAQTVVPCSL